MTANQENQQSSTPPLYKIPGTKVTSPYPAQLTPAETRLIFSLQTFFSPENIFPDCYYPKPTYRDKDLQSATLTDTLTQIDCVAIHDKGVFIFESKDYSGWIYGNGKHKYWTQVLNFGHDKFQFYNPILQNSRHILSLPNFGKTPIYSIIVFGRNAVLRSITQVPNGHHICTQSSLQQYLNQLLNCSINHKSHNNITAIRQTLLQSRINPTTIVRQNHLSEVPDHPNK